MSSRSDGSSMSKWAKNMQAYALSLRKHGMKSVSVAFQKICIRCIRKICMASHVAEYAIESSRDEFYAYQCIFFVKLDV
jgi:hypothetical protein